MIAGTIDQYGHPVVELSVLGLRGSLTAKVLIDTGFDGYLCLPVPFAVQVGLELWAELPVELADGTRKRGVFVPFDKGGIPCYIVGCLLGILFG